MKVAVNRCYGGFGLSHKAIMRYGELKGITLYPYLEIYGYNSHDNYIPYTGNQSNGFVHYVTRPLVYDEKLINDIYFSTLDIERNDPVLIQTIEELGKDANGDYADIEIVEIPDGIEWVIGEYDGMETVEESHRSW